MKADSRSKAQITKAQIDRLCKGVQSAPKGAATDVLGAYGTPN